MLIVHTVMISFVPVKLSEGGLKGVGAELRCQVTDEMMSTSVRKLIKSKLAACDNDHKAIFKVINALLQRNAGENCPNVGGAKSYLPKKINDFFTDKSDLIRHKKFIYSQCI